MGFLYAMRYIQGGEEERVWQELVFLGEKVRQEPLLSEVDMILAELMKRIKHNIKLLISRLRDINYVFLSENDISGDLKNPPLLNFNDEEIEELKDFNNQHGPLPLLLHTWYREIGTVDFLGYHLKLSHNENLCPYLPEMRGPISDPLMVSFVPLTSMQGFPYIWISPGSELKAGLSGSWKNRIFLPSHGIDAPLDSNDWPGILFMDYIRLAFRWGGFPGLSRLPEAVEAARGELAFLTNGLLPI